MPCSLFSASVMDGRTYNEPKIAVKLVTGCYGHGNEPLAVQ